MSRPSIVVYVDFMLRAKSDHYKGAWWHAFFLTYVFEARLGVECVSLRIVIQSVRLCATLIRTLSSYLCSRASLANPRFGLTQGFSSYSCQRVLSRASVPLLTLMLCVRRCTKWVCVCVFVELMAARGLCEQFSAPGEREVSRISICI